ncbi:MAG: T9SS type A sorting domain-containing protein [Saprospiraceae bacterium]
MKSFNKPILLLRLAMLFSFIFICNSVNATNYFVRTDGNNTNNGLSNTPTGAWKSVNDALYGYCNWGAGPTGQGVPMLPGDTLFVNDGLYLEDGYGYGLKIDGISGSNNNRFFLKSINKWGAKLQLSSQFNSFNIVNSKGITIDGFDIFNAVGSTNIYSGIVVNYPSEFVTIRNCKVHNFGLGGIGGDGSNIIVENNEVYDNSIRNAGNGSGINFYHPRVVSANRLSNGYGHIIRGNRVYNNYCNQFYTNVMGQPSPPTDGNGIIIDDWNFTQNSSGTPYKVPCLIENNVCFKNGGSGIRVYDSDNVTVRNNTCYYNCWVTANYPSGSNDYPSGDIGVSCEAGYGNNIMLVNNIAISDPSLPSSNYGIGVGNSITNSNVMNNYANKIFFASSGSANVIGADAKFVLAGTNPVTADFHLGAASPAINIGLNSNSAAKDYDGIVRPQGGITDAGAYERVGGCTPPNPGTISSAASLCVGSTTIASSTVGGGIWSISPTNVASINAASGLITGLIAGTATISYSVSANGCSATATASVVINAMPSAGTISSAASLCVGATTTASSTVGGGTWSISPTSVANINASSGLINGLSTGTATISYVVNANVCSATTTGSVVINALPSAGTISNAASLCVGSTITASSTVGGGTWSISPTNVASINASSGLITGLIAGTATISYTVSANGCSATATRSVVINAMPSAGTISSVAGLCVGSTTTASSTVGGGTWSINPTSVASINASSGLINGVGAGTATISYAVSANGCSATATGSVVINAMPSAGTISSAASLCVGSSTTANSTVGGGTWSINPTSVASINAASGLITGLSAGSATISYAVSANGCSATTTGSVVINAMPSAGIISSAASLCVGSTTTANATVGGGTWSISPASVASINAASGLITGLSAGTATISYSVSANGCSAITTGSVVINAMPSAGTISSTASLCVGSTTTASSTVGGGTWSINPTIVASINAVSGLITGLSAGTATISYSVSANGCSAITTGSVVINAMPSAGTISSAASLCVGSTTTAGSTVGGGTWSISPTNVATINAASALITGLSAGTATISYTFSANGCSSTITKTITLNSAATAPVFSVPSGTYTVAQNIVLSSTIGSNIRYTIDNTTPTAVIGTVYSAPIVVANTQTIKAIAYNATCTSGVSSAIYTFITPIVVRARSANSAGASMRVDVMSNSSVSGTTILQSKTFTNLATTFANYTFNATVTVQPQWVRVNFINDGGSPNYDLEVDYMKLKSTTYQTEAATTYGIGIWKGTGCNVGIFDQSSFLQCNGYFHYLATSTISAPTTGTSINTTSNLRLYPNPAKDLLHIDISSFEDQNLQLKILDITGREVWQQDLRLTTGQTEAEIPINLENGIYFLTTAPNRSFRTVKFIVQKN